MVDEYDCGMHGSGLKLPLKGKAQRLAERGKGCKAQRRR